MLKFQLNVTVGLDVEVTHPASANYDGPEHLSPLPMN